MLRYIPLIATIPLPEILFVGFVVTVCSVLCVLIKCFFLNGRSRSPRAPSPSVALPAAPSPSVSSQKATTDNVSSPFTFEPYDSGKILRLPEIDGRVGGSLSANSPGLGVVVAVVVVVGIIALLLSIFCFVANWLPTTSVRWFVVAWFLIPLSQILYLAYKLLGRPQIIDILGMCEAWRGKASGALSNCLVLRDQTMTSVEGAFSSSATTHFDVTEVIGMRIEPLFKNKFYSAKNEQQQVSILYENVLALVFRCGKIVRVGPGYSTSSALSLANAIAVEIGMDQSAIRLEDTPCNHSVFFHPLQEYAQENPANFATSIADIYRTSSDWQHVGTGETAESTSLKLQPQDKLDQLRNVAKGSTLGSIKRSVDDVFNNAFDKLVNFLTKERRFRI